MRTRDKLMVFVLLPMAIMLGFSIKQPFGMIQSGLALLLLITILVSRIK